jgi:hypothetical protein
MGEVKTRSWPRYEGSVIESVYEVIEVEKTVSPYLELDEPKLVP